MINSKQYLIIIFFTLFSTLLQAKVKRPNILFIFTDDQSYRTVSCYEGSYPWVHTPNIDRLADEGVRFRHAYMGSWCMPSRATMLTGLQQYGVPTMRMEGPYPGSTYDPEICRFWPAEFRKNGYQTAQIGKWHTGIDTGYGRDWDYQAVWNRPKYTDNAGSYYYDQLISFNGQEPVMVEGYSTDNYTDWAINYIHGENRDPEKPWFLWLCYGGVHAPFTPADRHLDVYPEAKVETPSDIYPPRPGKPDYMQRVEWWIPGPTGEPILKKDQVALYDDPEGIKNERTLPEWVRQYNQGVNSIDEGVGKLMAALEESGQLENTLVIFTSDQGFAWGQHGFRAKRAPYDDTIAAPLIFSMPGTIPENVVSPVPISGADMAPTIFGFADIPTPWFMHGYDLKPLLQDPTIDWDHPALLAYTENFFGEDTAEVPEVFSGRDQVPWFIMLRQGKYKYVRYLVEGEMEELYNLENDPEELHNLALEEGYQNQLKTMRAATLDELNRTQAPFLENVPSVSQKVK